MAVSLGVSVLFFVFSFSFLFVFGRLPKPSTCRHIKAHVSLHAALAVFKVTLVHYFKIRRSMITNQYTQPDDAKDASFRFLVALFKAPLLAFGPTIFSKEKLDSCVRNFLESELPFLLLCSVVKSPAPWFATAVRIFAWARLAHCVTFIAPVQPIRTLSFLPGFALSLAFSVQLLFF